MTTIVHKRTERCWFDTGQLTALRYFAFRKPNYSSGKEFSFWSRKWGKFSSFDLKK